MSTLVTIYWLCFGVGLVYVLVVGALGLIGGGIEALGGDADVDFDHDFDHDLAFDHDMSFDHGGLDLDGGIDMDVDADVDLDPDLDVGAGADGHGEVIAGHEPGIVSLFPSYNPLSPLSIAGFLTAFGGSGLIAASLNLVHWVTAAIATGGGMLMSLLLWLVVGKFIYGMQGSSEAHQADMIGIEAEVVTPMDNEQMGEIAYVLDGMRFTAPARLAREGHAAKREKVRIRSMKDNVVYVEQKRKLLN